MTSADLTAGPHEDEPHGDHASKLNWLRAAVLGANDGIVSVAGLVVGVAASTHNDPKAVAMAAVAGVAAGALSMAAGEYVSVCAFVGARGACCGGSRSLLSLGVGRSF